MNEVMEKAAPDERQISKNTELLSIDELAKVFEDYVQEYTDNIRKLNPPFPGMWPKNGSIMSEWFQKMQRHNLAREI